MSNGVHVRLNTPAGVVFEGAASVVEIRTAGSIIQFDRRDHGFMSLQDAAELTLRSGTRWLTFQLHNASAGFDDDQLTLMAERVEAVEGGRSSSHRHRRH